MEGVEGNNKSFAVPDGSLLRDYVLEALYELFYLPKDESGILFVSERLEISRVVVWFFGHLVYDALASLRVYPSQYLPGLVRIAFSSDVDVEVRADTLFDDLCGYSVVFVCLFDLCCLLLSHRRCPILLSPQAQSESGRPIVANSEFFAFGVSIVRFSGHFECSIALRSPYPIT